MNPLELHNITQELTLRRKEKHSQINATGKWTAEEHSRFLKAVEFRPFISWITISQYVGTRSARQTRAHAQKYFEKVRRRKNSPTSATSRMEVGLKLPNLSSLLNNEPVGDSLLKKSLDFDKKTNAAEVLFRLPRQNKHKN